MNCTLYCLETVGHEVKHWLDTDEFEQLNLVHNYHRKSETALKQIEANPFGLVLVNFEKHQDEKTEFCLKIRRKYQSLLIISLLPEDTVETISNDLKFAHQTLALSASYNLISNTALNSMKCAESISQSPALGKIFSNLESLPSPPKIYFQIREAITQPDCNAYQLSQLINKDHVLSARLLQVANSGFFSIPRKIADLKQAISLLGTETLLGLIVATHVFNSLPLTGKDFERLWKHGLGVALMAKSIALEAGAPRELVEISSIAGLLHDLGRLVFISNHSEEYQTIIQQTGGIESELIQYEKKFFGFNHSELAAQILMLWGLPDEVITAIKLHHADNYEMLSSEGIATQAVIISEWMFSLPDGPESIQKTFFNSCPVNLDSNLLDNYYELYLKVKEQL